jgi:hypothetical protein
MPFTCSICGEESTRICVRCTKDACDNHLCEKCLRCSDCCECEVKLSAPPRMMVHAATPDPVAAPIPPDPEPDPAPPLASPDPDPDPPSAPGQEPAPEPRGTGEEPPV